METGRRRGDAIGGRRRPGTWSARLDYDHTDNRAEYLPAWNDVFTSPSRLRNGELYGLDSSRRRKRRRDKWNGDKRRRNL
jgi:hypothetical protein